MPGLYAVVDKQCLGLEAQRKEAFGLRTEAEGPSTLPAIFSLFG
jgi:hypothetical protein